MGRFRGDGSVGWRRWPASRDGGTRGTPASVAPDALAQLRSRRASSGARRRCSPTSSCTHRTWGSTRHVPGRRRRCAPGAPATPRTRGRATTCRAPAIRTRDGRASATRSPRWATASRCSTSASRRGDASPARRTWSASACRRRCTSYVGRGRHRRKVTRTVTKTVLRKAPPPRARRDLQRRFRHRRARHARRRGRRAAHRARRLPARHDGVPRPRAHGRAAPVDARLLLRLGARRARRRTLRARHLRPHRQRGHGLRRREGGVSLGRPRERAPLLGREVARLRHDEAPVEMGHTFARSGRASSTSSRRGTATRSRST